MQDSNFFWYRKWEQVKSLGDYGNQLLINAGTPVIEALNKICEQKNITPLDLNSLCTLTQMDYLNRMFYLPLKPIFAGLTNEDKAYSGRG